MYFKHHIEKKLRILRWKNMLGKGGMSFRKYESMMWRLNREAKQFELADEEDVPSILRKQV